jgi:hypothetical protein
MKTKKFTRRQVVEVDLLVSRLWEWRSFVMLDPPVDLWG